ncbi:hypothetical protein ACFVHR_24845 [Streptomyces sp. NPDC127168]|uniref:hypothetical protein n=1 Tax=unclassified Streptomyces TaxID=2593676 RepID=UPI0036284D2C
MIWPRLVDWQVSVVELQAQHGLLEPVGEFLAHGAHDLTGVVRAEVEHAEDRDRVDGLDDGEGQAQPVVDRGADGAGLRADARAGQQELVVVVPGAVVLAQQVCVGRQFTVKEAAQWGARTMDT